MLNPYVMRKWAALIISSFMSVMFFFIGTQFYGIFVGVGTLFVGLLMGALVGNLLLKNPFTDMLQGKGILAMDLSSTGIINTFIVKVLPPYIKGKARGQSVDDIFDRESVMQLKVPRKIKNQLEVGLDGSVKLDLSEIEYNKARFQMMQYPVVIWNSQIKSILTKDFLSEQEKVAFAEHGVLYLNRKMEELTSHVRDFGRHIVELTRPKKGMQGSWWIYLIIGVFVIILIVMFAPTIINVVGGASGSAGSALDAAKNSGAAIVTRG